MSGLFVRIRGRRNPTLNVGRLAASNHPFVFIVPPNPEPDERVIFGDSNSTIVDSDPPGPIAPDLLEMQRLVSRVALTSSKVLSAKALDVRLKLIVKRQNFAVARCVTAALFDFQHKCPMT